MYTPKLNDNKVVFGPCRLSYTHLFEKHSFDGNNDEGSYSTNILIPKSETETVDAVKKAIDAARKAAIAGKWHGKEPKGMRPVLRDGDDKDDETYHGHWYLNAKCKTRPYVVDRRNNAITDEEEIYSGVWAVCSVTFYGFDVNVNKGIACGLNNVMKFKDDERLGGRVSAERDFAGFIPDDDDDDL